MHRPVLVAALVSALLSTSLWAGETRPGELMGSISCPSPCPTGVAVTESGLWIVDRFTDRIYLMDEESGKVVRTLEAPCYQPTGITVDGEGMLWVGADLPDFTHDQLYRVDPGSGDIVRIVPSPVDFVRSLAWEGDALRVGTRKGDLVKVDPDDGSVLSSSPVPSSRMSGLGFDGRYLWSGDRALDRLHVVEPSTGEVVFTLPAPGPSVSGVACRDGRVFVLDYEKRAVQVLRARGEVAEWTYEPRRATLCYRVVVHNLGSEVAPLLTAHIAIPESSSRQRAISEIRWEPRPVAFEEDQWGVRCARFEFADVPPGGTGEARMHVDVEMRHLRRAILPESVQGLDSVPAEIRERYLGDGRKFQLDHPYLQELVRETVGDETNPWWIARKLAHAVGRRMSYEMTGGWEPAPVVLQRGSGSCSEYTFAFLALCRVAGLPSRYVGAVVIRDEDGSCDEAFHRWAQVYLPPHGWVDWDVQAADAKMGGDFAERLCFRGNHRLVTTHGGGPSDILIWEYNGQHRSRTRGPGRVLVEKYGEWFPYADGERVDLPPP